MSFKSLFNLKNAIILAKKENIIVKKVLKAFLNSINLCNANECVTLAHKSLAASMKQTTTKLKRNYLAMAFCDENKTFQPKLPKVKTVALKH